MCFACVFCVYMFVHVHVFLYMDVFVYLSVYACVYVCACVNGCEMLLPVVIALYDDMLVVCAFVEVCCVVCAVE